MSRQQNETQSLHKHD